MSIRQSMSVMQVALVKFLPSSSATPPPSTVLFNDKVEFDWLGDYKPFQSESKLSDDVETLRLLEAEIYTLNDQKNTELGHEGPVVS